jgi:nucleoside-diphosphate-sugar epimerase
MIALVTGATGFVGAHLTETLVDQGWTVHAIVRDASDPERLACLPAAVVRHVPAETVEALSETLGAVRPDVVFHCATCFVGEHEPKHIEPLIAANVLFGTRLAEAMANTGCLALVNAGTGWQHYRQAEYSPASLYAATKQAFEAILQFYVEARGLRLVTLVLSDTYGAGDPRRKLLYALKQAAVTGKSLSLSPGEQVLDLTSVEDVTRAFLVAAQRLTGGGPRPAAEVFQVSSGERHTLREVVSIYGRVLGRPIPVVWGGRPYRAREMMEPWSGGLPLPGWRPQVRLEEGLAATGKLQS